MIKNIFKKFNSIADPYKTYWVLGMHDTNEQDGQRYDVQHYELHPYFINYTVYDDYDMAMITLQQMIQFGFKVHPICLTTTADDYTGRKVIVAGNHKKLLKIGI